MPKRLVLGIAALAAVLPYSIDASGGTMIAEQRACAQTGFCVEAGCGGGRDYCYQPPGGGMCYTTAKPPSQT